VPLNAAGILIVVNYPAKFTITNSATKEHVDIANKVVFIADSTSPTGVSEVPLTDLAVEAFQSQIELVGSGPWLFPSSCKPTEHQRTSKKLGKRLSYAPGSPTSGCRVTQMFRQSDAKVFKKNSQMKLQMKPEALTRLNRRAGDSSRKSFGTAADSKPVLLRFFGTS
jgi:hypothetical protein